MEPFKHLMGKLGLEPCITGTLPAVDFLLAQVPPEEKVKDNTDVWQRQHYNYPREGLDRVILLRNQNNRASHRQNNVQKEKKHRDDLPE